jgi:replicative superfamily II helicase
MTDENEKKDEAHEEKADNDDAVADLKRGVGLLFRAAKSAAQGAAHRAKDVAHAEKVENAFKTGVDDLQKAFDRLQSDKLEGAFKTSLQEIGRAFGNVAQTLERELRDNKDEKNDKK